MIWPSFVTITPEPSEFCTRVSSRGLRNCRRLRKKNSNGSSSYSRRIPTFFDVLTATTEGIAFDEFAPLPVQCLQRRDLLWIHARIGCQRVFFRFPEGREIEAPMLQAIVVQQRNS